MLIRKRYLYILCLAILCIAGACEKEASTMDYGITSIYMPQSMQSGNPASIVYNVPSGLDSATYNYIIDTPNNKVNIVLGVLRSGKAAGDAYSVTILTNPDTINAAIADGSLVGNPDPGAPIVLLPSSAYSLPPTVAVPSGSNQATFWLSVDKDQLKALSGKKAALAVYLAKPSRYQLSSVNSQTIVLIDVDALHL